MHTGRFHWRLAGAALAALVAACRSTSLPGEVPPAPRHAISGAVSGVDPGGVSIALEGEGIASTAVTADDGSYRFTGLLSGHYTVTPSRFDRAFSPPSLAVELGGQDVTGADFASAVARHTIAGTIGGATSSGVRVALAAAPPPGTSATHVFTVTDAAGRYAFHGLTSGAYTVSAEKPGHAFEPAFLDVTVAGTGVTGRDLEAAALAAPPVCAGDGWCWDAPQAGLLVAAWSAAPDDAWTVGGSGLIRRWNGTSWTRYDSGTARPLLAVWGSAADDVWAAGWLGTLLRFDGAGWTAVPSKTSRDLQGLWGSAATDVWAVGALGTIVHFDGASCATVASGTAAHLFGAWGSAADDVWAVGWAQQAPGGRAAIVRWNGTTWAPVAIPDVPLLRAVWGSAANDVWAVGNDGTALHFDGERWSPVATGTSAHLERVSGTASNDVWASGYDHRALRPVRLHWTGGGWASVPDAPSVWWSGSANDVWGLADRGLVHWNGSAWITVLPQSTVSADLAGLWGSSAADVWAVGARGAILPLGGGGWSWVASGTASDLLAVAGSGPDDAWAVGREGTILHWDGVRWSRSESGFAGAIGGVWAAAPDDAVAVGWDGGLAWLLRWDGAAWTASPAGPGALRDVWGSGPDDVFVAGDAGGLHWDGAGWSTVTPVAGTAVWGSGPDDVWTAGSGPSGGFVRRFDGSAATTLPLGAAVFLRPASISGTSASDVWVAGSAGVETPAILHWTGSAFTATAAVGEPLEHVWAASPTEVWAVGQRGRLLRYRP